MHQMYLSWPGIAQHPGCSIIDFYGRVDEKLFCMTKYLEATSTIMMLYDSIKVKGAQKLKSLATILVDFVRHDPLFVTKWTWKLSRLLPQCEKWMHVEGQPHHVFDGGVYHRKPLMHQQTDASDCHASMLER